MGLRECCSLVFVIIIYGGMGCGGVGGVGGGGGGRGCVVANIRISLETLQNILMIDC